MAAPGIESATDHGNATRTLDPFAALDFGRGLNLATPAAFALLELSRILTRRTKHNEADLPRYIPVDEVGPTTSLVAWHATPVVPPPCFCRLCGGGFATTNAFRAHMDAEHGGEAEYRKRVIYHLKEGPPYKVLPQEKRAMIHGFAEAQRFSVEGARTNGWVRGRKVERCERACCFCARLDWLENRFPIKIFAAIPEEDTGEEEMVGNAPVDEEVMDTSDPLDHDHNDGGEHDEDGAEPIGAPKPARFSYDKDGALRLRNPFVVDKLLSVYRYEQRWDKIPRGELHASAVDHPFHPGWRWLLHTRCVPVEANTGAACPPRDSPSAVSGGDTRPCADSPENGSRRAQEKWMKPPILVGSVGMHFAEPNRRCPSTH